MYLLPDMNPWPDRSSPGCDHPTTLVNDADIHQVCRGCTGLIGLGAKQSWNGSQSLLSKAFFILSLSLHHTHTHSETHLHTYAHPNTLTTTCVPTHAHWTPVLSFKAQMTMPWPAFQQHLKKSDPIKLIFWITAKNFVASGIWVIC